MIFIGAVCNEINVDGYHCLNNRDKLPAFRFVCRLSGLSLDLFDSQQISVSIHIGKHSSYYVCKTRTANRGHLTFACTRCPACHHGKTMTQAQRELQHSDMKRHLELQ